MEEKKQVKGISFLRQVGAVPEAEKGANPEQELEEINNQTKKIEARARLQNTVDQVMNPPSVAEIRAKREQEIEQDRNAMAQRAQELESKRLDDIETERQNAITKAEEERNKREEAERSLAKEREQSLIATIQNMEARFSERLERAMANNSGDKDIILQIRAWKDAVSELGMLNPSAGRDANIDVEIAKMQYQQAKEEREFKWKMAQDEKQSKLEFQASEREWQLKLEELKQGQRRDEMLASLPKVFGSAIAQGIIDGGLGSKGTDEGTLSGIPKTPRTPQNTPGGLALEIGEGEAGNTECPACHESIGVEADTTLARCVGCGEEYPVIRIPAG